MKPFHFGTSKSPLYGVYHAPSGPGAASGVVLCAPFGHEYIRSHRMLRLLASRLAEAGLHVLRFDYSACGDSAGASEDGSFEQWRKDVNAAADELKDMAMVPRVSFVGLRLGATLAMYSAAGRSDVDTVVACDPVLAGGPHLADLAALQARWFETRPPFQVPATWRGPAELIGFPVTERLRQELDAADVRTIARWPARRVVLVASGGTRSDELQSHILGSKGACESRQVSCDCRWDEPSTVHQTLLANELIDAVIGILAAKVAA
jgi:uncharacterized protein